MGLQQYNSVACLWVTLLNFGFASVSVNELTQFRFNFTFIENTYHVIWGLFDCQQSDITFSVYKVLWYLVNIFVAICL